MGRAHTTALTLATVLLAAAASTARAQTEDSRAVANGGISIAGWTGKIDAREEKAGRTLKDALLAPAGKEIHVRTGPAVTYWNPANTVSGDYTVSAKFHEPEYMGLNDHPHPYGIVIGGNDLGTDQQSYLYCAAYGDGTFIVRGFSGLTPFQLGGRSPTANAAVHKAEAKGKEVYQDIALSVKGDKVECAINGTVVASYPKSEVVGPGKLKSTDGIYGIRFAHNTEGHVLGLKATKGK